MTVHTFRPGDRLVLNAHGREAYPTLRSMTGTYLHPARDTVRLVVQRDGRRRPEIWSSTYWDLAPAESDRPTEVLPVIDRAETGEKVTINLKVPAILAQRVRETALAQQRTVTSVIRAALELSLELSARVAAGERVVCEHPETGERTRMLVPGS